MPVPAIYKRRLEIFEAVRFIRINKQGNAPEVNHLLDWVKFALDHKILHVDAEYLIWGYKELDKRIKTGNWIMRSTKTGTLNLKTDIDEFLNVSKRFLAVDL